MREKKKHEMLELEMYTILLFIRVRLSRQIDTEKKSPNIAQSKRKKERER